MLSEQIYTLRRKSGLSQEQLAEKVGVSRQAVSKWETGASVPELDKLLALSEFFGVSVEELTSGAPARREDAPPPRETPVLWSRLGIALCLAGAVLLLLAGGILLFAPSAAERLDASSTVTISGSGMLFLLAAAAVAAGAVLFFRKK
ncbi:MAG TPA: helix-turn-helix transcriptional regulator [Candidatus Merdivicinus faecavium]|nr:helix-turn-helix transcriptional regulator [Candidatus Merdivicinus faecavium]